MCLWESATSKWGLGREVQVASLVLRVKGQPECPQDNLRELMRDSNPICGIAWETKKNKQTKKDFSCKRLSCCMVTPGVLTQQRIE